MFRNLILSVVATNCMVVFYEKNFQWSDFSCIQTFPRFYRSRTSKLKALICFGVIWMCLSSSLMSQPTGAVGMVLLALPQLYRANGRFHQQLRVTLGPLTPILALNNLLIEPNSLALLSAVTCILAFVVLRPDNTAVIDLFLPFFESKTVAAARVTTTTSAIENFNMFASLQVQSLMDNKTRRKAHGTLAAFNTAVAMFAVIYFASNQGSCDKGQRFLFWINKV